MEIALHLPPNNRQIHHAFIVKNDAPFEVDRPVQAWRWMIQTRCIPEQQDWVRPEVWESWRRCLEDYQLPLGNYAHWDHLNTCHCKAAADEKAERISKSLTALGRQFHAFLKEAGVLLVLTDAGGGLLQTMGDEPFAMRSMQRLHQKNSNWSESLLGNNGIGTATLLQKPVAFQGMEHFLSLLHPFTTIGYPLLDDDGRLAAVIGLVSDRRESVNSLFAFLHLLCVLLNTSLPLTQSPVAQTRVLDKIRLKTAKQSTLDESTLSPQLTALLDKAVKLQQHKIAMLITGESGVGKDHFVNLLRQAGPRSQQPLVAINCAAIPHDLIESELFGYEAGSFTGARSIGKPGKFLLADKGILFLDEIGDMSLDLQSTLLRVLETSEFTPIGGCKPIKVDVQIVAATNVPLLHAVEAGRFRRDLYYRLNGSQIHLPPLRERPDKKAIIHHILQRELANLTDADTAEIDSAVMAMFEQHPWPGNIRQLINVIRATVYTAASNLIGTDDLPLDFVAEFGAVPSPSKQNSHANGQDVASSIMTLDDWEMHGIKMSMWACAGNISQAARQLGITRTTLYKKIDRFGLNQGDWCQEPRAG